MHNKHEDSLATLASKVNIPEDATDTKVIKKTLQATAAAFIPAELIDEKDWRTSVIQDFLQPSSIVVAKELKEYTLVKREFYL